MSIYDFTIKSNKGEDISMSAYKGKVLLIVNTATKCGFAPQFNDLETLYQEYSEKGLEILAFPCNQFLNQEPGSDSEIANVCQINYGLSFPLMAKIDVNGGNAHPLYKYLQKNSTGLFSSAIKWNFTKFLVDSNGQIVNRYAPTVSPISMKNDIEKLLEVVKV